MCIAMKLIIEKFNSLIKDFQNKCSDYEDKIGQGCSTLKQEGRDIITKTIPETLYNIFDKENYVINGSVGKGRVASCAWVSVSDRKVKKDIPNGASIVFVFSKDLRLIYLTVMCKVANSSKEDLIKYREQIQQVINVEDAFLNHKNDLNIDNLDYKNATIFSCEWNLNNVKIASEQLTSYINAYNQYIKYSKGQNWPENNTELCSPSIKTFSIDKVISIIKETGLQYDETLIKRFAFSLMTKPFVILSGLAGSGKTQLALAFAKTLIEDKSQMCTVSVGADWTNREPLLGFPNALSKENYQMPESGVLQLLIDANKHLDKPYFIILDEMNMSYVERYFSDFLSVMESNEAIKLWEGYPNHIVPKAISLPKNVYIIGTINVDETTYMFSPKVLDRSNVIEFKISTEEMETFLSKASNINTSKILGRASEMSEDFVKNSRSASITSNDYIKTVLVNFFRHLKHVNAEFGYRSANEIFKFIDIAQKYDDTDSPLSIDLILDSAIVQKLLPKLHGSRKKLAPVLNALWDLTGANYKLDEATEILPNIKFKLSADKILRMYRSAIDNGFTSFSEA